MFCKNCGKELSEQSKFCPYCGSTTLEESVQQQPVVIEKSTSFSYNPDSEDIKLTPVKKKKKIEPVVENTKIENKEKKSKKGLVIFLVLLIAVAGVIGAIMLRGGQKEPAVEEIPDKNDFVIYIKDRDMHLTYTENNETIVLAEDAISGSLDRYAYKYGINSVTYYNKDTGYLYFPSEMRMDGYTFQFKLSRIKLDSGNTNNVFTEIVIDDWTEQYEGYTVAPDDSKVIYRDGDEDLYYYEFSTDTRERIEKDVNNCFVDFGKNHCYYSDKDEVYYMDLSTMESEVIYTAGYREENMHIEYAGDNVLLHADGDVYLMDKDGEKTYVADSGYIHQVGEQYYLVQYKEGAEQDLSQFVKDDCYDADSAIKSGDTGYAQKRIRDEIRDIVSEDELYIYANDDIYLIEGNELKPVISGVNSYSQGGTMPTACYKDGDVAEIITISEIYERIVEDYDVDSYYGIKDYYVSGIVRAEFDKYTKQYIIYNGVATKVFDEYVNYIDPEIILSEEEGCIYFRASIGSYMSEEYGYETSNPTKLYKAVINADNTVGAPELVREHCETVTAFSQGNIFAAAETDWIESGEYYWISYANLYLNDNLIDSGVAVSYMESYTDDFNRYKGNKALYVKNVDESDDEFAANLYYYDGKESFSVKDGVNDYELSGNGVVYYVAEGELVRYSKNETRTIDSGVKAVIRPDKIKNHDLRW